MAVNNGIKRKVRALMKAHAKKGEKLGWCVQCCHPWYDGICECGNWTSEMEDLAALVIENDLA